MVYTLGFLKPVRGGSMVGHLATQRREQVLLATEFSRDQFVGLCYVLT